MTRDRFAHLTAFVGHDPNVNGDWEAVLWLTGTPWSWLVNNAFLSRGAP